MKVKELIKLLKECNQNATVILSKDSEGNGFSPAYSVTTGFYKPETTWSGELVDEEDEDTEKAVIIDPTN